MSGDEVYSADPDLRDRLEQLQLGYVLGIGCNRGVTVHGGAGGVRLRVDQIAAPLRDHCWAPYSASAGAMGPRFYEWAFVALHPDDGHGRPSLVGDPLPSRAGELAYYRATHPDRCN